MVVFIQLAVSFQELLHTISAHWVAVRDRALHKPVYWGSALPTSFLVTEPLCVWGQ